MKVTCWSGTTARVGGIALLLLLPWGVAAVDVSPDSTTAAAGAAPPAKHAHERGTVGIASVYAKMLDGRKTASGEAHDSDELVAAHRTLPLGSEVRVTNLRNHRSVVVRINDRGPNVKSRIIDLSPRAGAAIGLHAHDKGITRVRLDVLREGEGAAAARSPAPLKDVADRETPTAR